MLDELQRRHYGASIQRLERGRYHFPDKATDAGVQLTPGEFQMILDGIDLSKAKRFKRYQREPIS